MENFDRLVLNPESLGTYKMCFDANGSNKDVKKIQWQFFNEADSGDLVEIAYDRDNQRAAAIYAISRVHFQIENQSLVGTQSLDTITDVNYRGKGLFINLAKSVYDKARKDGISLVYGFPNGNSIHGFENKLGWTVLDPVPFLIKPLKTKFFSDRIRFLRFMPNISLPFFRHRETAGHTISQLDYFPEEVTDLWKKFSKNVSVSVYRDKHYLDWRYIEKPDESYQIYHCYDSDQFYRGFVVFTVKDKHDGRVGYIMELIFDPSYESVGRQLLSLAVSKIREQNGDLILAWCFDHSPNYKAFSKMLFFNLPLKLRPIELHFGVLSFQDRLKSILGKRENWYISYSDSDTV